MDNVTDSGLDKAKECIKKLKDTISDENKTISEFAYILAFFHQLSTFMSLSLIKTKKTMTITTRIPEVRLWIDIEDEIVGVPTIFPQTQILNEVVNQYLLILNSWSYETANNDFLRALHKVHLSFNNLLSYSYANKLNQLVFDKVNPIKIVKSENKLIDNYSNYRLRQKYSSIFHNIDIKLFLPTVDSINEFSRYLKLYKNLNSNEALVQIKNDLDRSCKELSYLLSDEKICNIYSQDLIQNPSRDIVRENPQFQQYEQKMSSMFPLILTEFFDLNTNIMNLFSRINYLNKLLEKSFALPLIDFDKLHQATTEDIKYNIEKLKIMFKKEVFIKFFNACPKFEIQTATFIKKIYKKYSALSQTKDIDLIESQLTKLNDYLKNSNYEQVFKDQEKEQISLKKNMDDKLRNIESAQLPKLTREEKLIIEERRKTVEELQNTYISERKIMNDEMVQSIFKHRTLFSNVQHKPLFPCEIEKMLQTLAHQTADFIWMNQRFEKQKEENKKLKESVTKLNDDLSKLKDEIQKKKKLIQNLKANSAQKNPIKSAVCLCSSCHAKQVECMIIGCGHTFCEECLQNIKSCPKCNHMITENDVCKVNWT